MWSFPFRDWTTWLQEITFGVPFSSLSTKQSKRLKAQSSAVSYYTDMHTVSAQEIRMQIVKHVSFCVLVPGRYIYMYGSTYMYGIHILNKGNTHM